MEYKRFGNHIVARLDRGDEITASILNIAKAENVSLASVSGIGATDDVTVGVFSEKAQAYEQYTFTGTHEITALVGNLTVRDGAPYSHLHITLAGDGGTVVGGHLLRCVISLTGELFLSVIDGIVQRKLDPEENINKFAF